MCRRMRSRSGVPPSRAVVRFFFVAIRGDVRSWLAARQRRRPPVVATAGSASTGGTRCPRPRRPDFSSAVGDAGTVGTFSRYHDAVRDAEETPIEVARADDGGNAWWCVRFVGITVGELLRVLPGKWLVGPQTRGVTLCSFSGTSCM